MDRHPKAASQRRSDNSIIGATAERAAHSEGVTLDFTAQSDVLLIMFGGFKGSLLIPPFEFLSMLSDFPVKRIFLRDLDQAWYQLGIRGVSRTVRGTASFLEEAILESKASRIVAIGTSMGGFAALLFGSLLNVTEVHAFSPQTTIALRHRLHMHDGRWRRALFHARRRMRPFTSTLDVRPAVSLSSAVHHVYYGNREVGDVRHAQRLAGLANVTLHEYPYGHLLVKRLRDSGELQRVLLRAAQGPSAATDA